MAVYLTPCQKIGLTSLTICSGVALGVSSVATHNTALGILGILTTALGTAGALVMKRQANQEDKVQALLLEEQPFFQP